MKPKIAVGVSAILIFIGGVSAMGCSSAHDHAQVYPPQPSGDESRSASTAPTSWHKVEVLDCRPLGWEFHQLRGIDSYVSEFVGDGVVLGFDYGMYADPLDDEKEPS
jgi:hypothetical protein